MLEFINTFGDRFVVLIIIIGLAIIMFEETNKINKK